MDNDEISCPYCGSKLISTTQKGFSLGKAAVGGVLLGPLGLLAGTHKSKDIMFYCMACQRKFTYEDYLQHRRSKQRSYSEEPAVIEYQRDKQENVILHTPEFEKEQEKEKDDPTNALIFIIIGLAFLAIVATVLHG